MPVVFNEPLSFLQRMLEYLEYAHLLRMASEQTDPVARMEYIAGPFLATTTQIVDTIWAFIADVGFHINVILFRFFFLSFDTKQPVIAMIKEKSLHFRKLIIA